MAKPCITPGCRLLAHTGPRCPMCERTHQSVRNADPKRKEYDSVGYRAARKRVIGLPCWRCGVTAETADHIVPLRDGGTWRMGLRPACRSHNSDWATT